MDPDLRKRLDALKAAAPAAAPALPDEEGMPELPAEFRTAERGLDAPPEAEKPWFERYLGMHQMKNGETPPISQEDSDTFNRRFENLSTIPGAIKQLGADQLAGILNMVPGGEAAIAERGAPFLAKLGARAKNLITEGGHAAATSAANAASNSSEHVGDEALMGGALGAALPPVARGLMQGGKNLIRGGNDYVTRMFMTGPERARYTVRHGPEGLADLGADARDVGLLKRTHWSDWLRAPTASRVATNASHLDETLGKQVGAFEESLTKRGINPDTDVTAIVKQLRDEASAMEQRLGTAANKDAKYLRKQAADLEIKSRATVEAKDVPPPAPQSEHAEQKLLPEVDVTAKPPMKPWRLVGRTFPPAKPEVQESLPRSVEPPQTSLDIPLTPSKRPKPATRTATPEVEQTKLPLERSGQTKLKLDERGQQGLDFDQSKPVGVQNQSPGDGQLPISADEPLANADVTPGRPRVPALGAPGARGLEKTPAIPPKYKFRADKSVAKALGDTQLPMDLATQRKLNLPAREVRKPWKPGDLRGEQQKVSGTNKPISVLPQRLPYTSLNKQDVLPLPPFVAKQKPPSIPPVEGVPTGQYTRPLDKNVDSTRDLGRRIAWDKRPGSSGSYVEDMAQKFMWGGQKDAARAALEQEVAAGRLGAKELAKHQQNVDALHTVKTVYEPALKMSERNAAPGLSLHELLLGSAAGGTIGPALTAASRLNRGTLPGLVSGTMRNAGHMLEGVGTALDSAGSAAGNIGPSLEHARESVADRNKRISDSLRDRLNAKEDQE